MGLIEIPQLVFSTRAARPQMGSEFTREIVARSPGIDETVAARFTEVADLTLSTGHQHHLQPIFTFETLPPGPDGRELRLACRFASLGTYRKTSHHMLVHGLILDLDAALALRANPFALGAVDLVRTLEAHPGRSASLPALSLQTGDLHEAVRRFEARRLPELNQALEAWHPHLAGLFDGLAQADRRPPFALVGGDRPPESRVLEWLWLHLHPADRLELSFHTWPVYDRPRSYDLVMGRERDVAPWRRAAPALHQWSESNDPPSGSPLFQLTRRLLKKEPQRFHQILDRYRLAHWSGHGLEPIAERDARLVLGQKLGAELSADEEARVRVLSKRGTIPLLFHSEELAAQRHLDGGAFVDEARRRAADPSLLQGGMADLDLVLEHIAAEDPAAGLPLSMAVWALILGFQDRLSGDRLSGDRLSGDVEESMGREVAARFRRHVSVSRLGDLLQACGGPRQAVPERVFWPLVLMAATDRLRGAVRQPNRTEERYWPLLLRWLGAQGLSVLRPAAELERALLRLGAGSTSADPALERLLDQELLSLEELMSELGQKGFALKIRLQRRAPRLPAADRDALLRATLRSILDGTGEDDEALRAPLSRDKLCATLWQELEVWLLEDPGSESRWQRWLALFEKLPDSLDAERGSEAGALLAAMALSPRQAQLAPGLEQLLAAGPDDGAEAARFESRLWRRLEQGLWTVDGNEIGDRWAAALGGLARLRRDLDQGIEHPLDGLLVRFGLVAALGLSTRDGATNDGATRELRTALTGWLDLLRRRDGLVKVIDRHGNPVHWCNALFDLLDPLLHTGAADDPAESRSVSVLLHALEELERFIHQDPRRPGDRSAGAPAARLPTHLPKMRRLQARIDHASMAGRA